MERLLKYVLPVYLLIYFLAAFFWHSYKVGKATGINPFVLGSTDSVHDYIGKVFRLVFALIVATVIVYVVSDKAYGYLMPLAYLENGSVKVAGLVLLSLYRSKCN